MDKSKLVYMERADGPVQHHFSLYQNNGGSVVAIGGNGFAVIASDTRLSAGYSIYTRNQPKLHVLNGQAVLGSTGCWSDVLTFTKVLLGRMKLYVHEHQKDMKPRAIAQLLSTLLYYRRLLPYYISNVLAGLEEVEEDGNKRLQGYVYSYDPVGHCEKSTYQAGGSSGALLQPFLDSQIGHKNMKNPPTEPLTMERAVQVIKDVFISAAERDIKTGDGIMIKILTADGIQEELFPLRAD